MNNTNTMFPWLSESQIQMLEKQTANLTWWEKRQAQAKIYQMVINMQKQEKFNDDRLSANNELWSRSLDVKDTKQQNFMQNQSRMELAADRAKDFFWLDAQTPTETAIWGMLDYWQDKWVNLQLFEKYLNEWDETFFYDLWMIQKENPFKKAEENKSNVWWNIAIWAWATLWTAVGLMWTSPIWKLADLAYWSTISASKKDKDIQYTRDVAPKEIEEYRKQVAEREQLLKDIAEDSRYSESMKQSASESIQKEIDSLNESIRKAEFRLDKANAPTTAETAYEYGIKWVSSDDIWKKAELEANKLWNWWVQVKLDSSKERVNLKELLDEVDVSKLAKDNNEIPKLQEALDMFKESYKDPKYANMNMADANNFKSNLYDKIPASAWDGKEIQNAYKKVINEISSLVKTDTQEKLTAEFWEDIAKQYLDWANLHNIAEWNKMEWLGKSRIFKSWVFSKAAAAVDTALTPILSEWWYYMKKVNEWIKSIPWKIKNAASDLLWYVKENPVKAVKEWVKWLTKEMPATVIMDEMIKNQEYIQDNPMAQKANAFNAVSESQWSKLANKSEVEELLKTPEFREAAGKLWLDLNNLAKKFKINSKEVNTTVDKQNKQKAEDNKNKLSLSAKIENENKKNKIQNSTINQLNKTASLKSQKTTVWTKKKSGK